MQSKNKNDSIQLPTRYQCYDFAKFYLRGTSRPEVFPFGEQSEEDNRRTGTDVSYCLDANYHKGTNTLKKGRRQLVYNQYNKRKMEKTCGTLGTCNTRTSKQGYLVVKKVVGKVKVRKHIVNIEKLKTVLRENRKPIREIAEKLNVKKTTVEHWFRKDNCFAIPEAEVWFELKELLGIKTDEFDKSITEFEIRDNKFDMANRVYQKEGISPTLTTLTGGQQHSIVDDGYSIRRLTPTECMRLQGFPDHWCDVGADGKEISDTQKYKMAGNAVTVNVVREIIKKLI